MAVIAEAVANLEDLLTDLNSEEIEQVVSTLKKIKQKPVISAENDLIQTLVGHSYSTTEKFQLEIESLFRYFEQRRQLLQGALTAPEVAKLLGTSRQTPHDRLKNQSLLAILDKGVYLFPFWQFDPEGADGVIDGFPEVLKALKVSDFAKLNWLMRPHPLWDNLTPLQRLKQGDKDTVIQEAARVGVSI
jgi:hypothetical protein